jgi:hypothetical protein
MELTNDDRPTIDAVTRRVIGGAFIPTARGGAGSIQDVELKHHPQSDPVAASSCQGARFAGSSHAYRLVPHYIRLHAAP